MNILKVFQSGKRHYLLIYLGLQIAFFVLYTLINHVLFDQSIVDPYLMFFGEKSLLLLKGIPPRLENIGFIYPPMPILIISLFNGNVILAQNFIASLVNAYMVLEIIMNVRSFGVILLLVIFIAFSFPVLFLSTQRFDLYLYFFMTILSAKYLYKYVKENYSLYLFLAGPFFGLTFFLHFSSIYLIPMFLILIFSLYEGDIKKFTAVSLVFITPYLIFLMIFMYINWIFTSEAYAFLKNYMLFFSNQDIEAVIASGNVLRSLEFMLKYLFSVFPVIIPCLLGMYYDRRLVGVIPFVIIFSFIYTNLFFPAVYASVIFIIEFLLMTDFNIKFKPKVLTAALCISLLFSARLSMVSKETHEKRFTKAFFGTFDKNVEEYKKITDFLRDKEGKILLDDGAAYPVVYLMGTPERFILPYQFEFVSALSNPLLYADFVIALKNAENDSIYNMYRDGIKGFSSVFDDGRIIIWERVKT